MLNGELTGLRARTADDAEILHEELYENVEDWVRGSNLHWGDRRAQPDGAHSWMNGRFMDDVIFGSLADEFSG